MKKIIKSFLMVLSISLILTGCGSNSVSLQNNITVADIVNTIVEENEVTMPQTADDTIAESLFYLDLADVEEYSIQLSMVNVSADNVALVKAKDGKVNEVKKALEKRLKDVQEQFAQYLPDQKDKADKAEVYVKGDYVLLPIVADPEGAISTLNDNLK